MKTVEIKKSSDLLNASIEDCIEAIHKCARANGSEYAIQIEACEDSKGLIKFSTLKTYANGQYTVGYNAVRYLIDNMGEIAYSHMGDDRFCFVHDYQKFIKELS